MPMRFCGDAITIGCADWFRPSGREDSLAEPARSAEASDLQELFQFTDAQPMHEGPDAGSFMAELRRDVRY